MAVSLIYTRKVRFQTPSIQEYKVAENTDREFPQFLMWHQLPSWQQDNEYILSGYRAPSGSFKISLQSLMQLNNETVNIYSHLVGAITFAALPIVVYNQVYPRYQSANARDIVVFSTFFLGITVCFILSAIFHIIANHSPKVAAVGNQLDYMGIVVLIWGSTIPSVYYGFYCNPELQSLYWGFISILAIVCSIATLHPRFRHPSLRPYRSAMYSGLGFSALMFIIHGIVLYGWDVQSRRMSLEWMGIMAGLNIIGALVYSARIPERWYPHRYDKFGASHQILHFMVIFAGVAHMIGLLSAFDHVHANGAKCS